MLRGFLSKTYLGFTFWIKSWSFQRDNLWRARFCKMYMVHRLPDTKILCFRTQTFSGRARKVEPYYLAGWSRLPPFFSNEISADWGRHTGRTLSHTFLRAGAISVSFAQCQFLCSYDSMSLSWDSYNPPQTSCALTIRECMPTHNLYPSEWAKK